MANYIDIKKVSEMLGVTARTVRNYIKDKKLPAYKVGKAWKFIESEVDEWVKVQK